MVQELEIQSGRLTVNKKTAVVDWIDYVDPSITYDEFFSKYLAENKPCIFKSSITENWSCKRQWSLDDAPDFDVLDISFGKQMINHTFTHFVNYSLLIEDDPLVGDCVVPIADCKTRYYNSQSKDDMTMKDYLNYWMDYAKNNYPDSMPLLYLKDWHCQKLFPNAPMYTVPEYFASDWLNEYYMAHPDLNDDYRFVYMGPKGTW